MTLEETCSRLAAISDPLRMRMLALMGVEGELCVCELVRALAIPQPKASKHLAILRNAGLVRVRREARWVLYGIVAEEHGWLDTVLDATIRLIGNGPEMTGDRHRLATMDDRPAFRRREENARAT